MLVKPSHRDVFEVDDQDDQLDVTVVLRLYGIESHS